MNESAFPRPFSGTTAYAQEGMTLRDYFAAKALQAFESRQDLDDIPAFNKANRCYRIADAMLKARTE